MSAMTDKERKARAKRLKNKQKKAKNKPVKRRAFVNIPKVNPDKDWYIHKTGQFAVPSPTEDIIRNVLNGFNFEFHIEVSFKNFGHKDFPFRFDFYIPSKRLILEYDGAHHKKRAVKINDTIKNKFCKLNNLKIVRFNKEHYANLELNIIKIVNLI